MQCLLVQELGGGSAQEASAPAACPGIYLPFLALLNSYCPCIQAGSPHLICPVEKGTLLQSWGIWEEAPGAGGMEKCIIWLASHQLQSPGCPTR